MIDGLDNNLDSNDFYKKKLDRVWLAPFSLDQGTSINVILDLLFKRENAEQLMEILNKLVHFKAH